MHRCTLMAATVLYNAKAASAAATQSPSSAWQAVESIHRTLVDLAGRVEPAEGCWLMGLQKIPPLKNIMLLRAIDLGATVTGVFEDGASLPRLWRHGCAFLLFGDFLSLC